MLLGGLPDVLAKETSFHVDLADLLPLQPGNSLASLVAPVGPSSVRQLLASIEVRSPSRIEEVQRVIAGHRHQAPVLVHQGLTTVVPLCHRSHAVARTGCRETVSLFVFTLTMAIRSMAKLALLISAATVVRP